MGLNRRHFLAVGAAGLAAAFAAACSSGDTGSTSSSSAAAPRPANTLLRNVRVLDVRAGKLGAPTDVLVRGNLIAGIGTGSPRIRGPRSSRAAAGR